VTDEREAELLRAVRFLNCKGEVQGFLRYLESQNETMTGPLQAALAKHEGKLK
jgi:hypothetical protein